MDLDSYRNRNSSTSHRGNKLGDGRDEKYYLYCLKIHKGREILMLCPKLWPQYLAQKRIHILLTEWNGLSVNVWVRFVRYHNETEKWH